MGPVILNKNSGVIFDANAKCLVALDRAGLLMDAHISDLNDARAVCSMS